VTSWKPPSGGIAGSGGPAVGPDGTVYVTTESGDLVSLEAKTLKMKDVYRAGQAFTSSPLVFQYKDKVMVTAGAKDGSVHVVDAGAMTTAVAKSAAGSTVQGALASWQDAAGTRWILAPVEEGKIVALKLAEQNGATSFVEGWKSAAIPSPLAPMIVNGVVFTAASGEFQTKDGKMTAAQRAQKSTGAVLYALDSATGKELWNSGKTITSFTHNGGLSGGGAQVYLETYDGTVYSFGFPIEH
jgi:outer membrane protein assembly factor BamB